MKLSADRVGIRPFRGQRGHLPKKAIHVVPNLFFRVSIANHFASGFPFHHLSGISGPVSGCGCRSFEGLGVVPLSSSPPPGYNTSITEIAIAFAPLVTMSTIPVNSRRVKYLFSQVARSYLSPRVSLHRRALLFYVK